MRLASCSHLQILKNNKSPVQLLFKTHKAEIYTTESRIQELNENYQVYQTQSKTCDSNTHYIEHGEKYKL
jgi:hypothetical protein